MPPRIHKREARGSAEEDPNAAKPLNMASREEWRSCNVTRVPYLSSLSCLRDHSILRHYLRHSFRACGSVSFSCFDHAVPL